MQEIVSGQIGELTKQISRVSDMVEKLTTTSAVHANDIEYLKAENSRLSREIRDVNNRDRNQQSVQLQTANTQVQNVQDRIFQGGLTFAQMLNAGIWVVLGYLIYHAMQH